MRDGLLDGRHDAGRTEQAQRIRDSHPDSDLRQYRAQVDGDRQEQVFTGHRGMDVVEPHAGPSAVVPLEGMRDDRVFTTGTAHLVDEGPALRPYLKPGAADDVRCGDAVGLTGQSIEPDESTLGGHQTGIDGESVKDLDSPKHSGGKFPHLSGTTGRGKVKQGRDLLTVEEVAQRFGFAVGTIYNWSHKRLLPAVKIGGALRFESADVDAFIARHKRKAIRRVRGLDQ